jgi:type VI secretion system secreted protein VgrG
MTTQDNRLLKIETPLGKDFLLLERISGTEGISELFSFSVSLLHEENESSYESTVVDPRSIVGHGVTVQIKQRDNTIREISGIVNRFSQGSRNERFTFYSADIVPYVWILTKKSQSRIFQNITVKDILDKVFAGFEVQWELQGEDRQRNYCVQYRESDFDFASRLMEEEGYYYYFEHSDGRHKLIIANTPQSHRDCPSKAKIPFYTHKDLEQQDFVTTITAWQTKHQLETGKVTFWDHNFQLPKKHLDHSQTSAFSLGDSQKLELYDYPGGYSRKYDGVDSSGGDSDGELNKVEVDKVDTVKHVMESLDRGVKVITGQSNCSSMTPGYRFTLHDHPDNGVDGMYVLTSIYHEADQNPSYVSDESSEEQYSNTFTCISHGAGAPPVTPVRKTPRPYIYGSQTATVVGPAGEEIFTDKYGRVKVQFHWDRDGQLNLGSSCWVRVAQMWAGNKWGSVFIPRIGMEVVVHFLDGNPDEPLITGTVYNPLAMPPYNLPEEMTKSTIKSNSSKGSGGFNEFRFEDKKGSEQIFIHGVNNQDIRIKKDAMELIGNDRHLIVKQDQFENVKRDKHLKVVGDQNEQIGGAISIKAGMDIEEKAGTKFAVDAGTEIHLKSGSTMTLETGVSLTLKVGGNFININSGGVFISGTMVMINSGGAAGSGSGSNPEAPKEPKEADNAEPGNTPKLPPVQAPPQRPEFKSPAALVMINAAQSGAAFCEICSRG